MTVGMNMNRYRTINAEEMYDDRDRVGSKGTNAQDYDYGMWAYIRPQRMIYHLSRELEKTVRVLVGIAYIDVGDVPQPVRRYRGIKSQPDSRHAIRCSAGKRQNLHDRCT